MSFIFTTMNIFFPSFPLVDMDDFWLALNKNLLEKRKESRMERHGLREVLLFNERRNKDVTNGMEG